MIRFLSWLLSMCWHNGSHWLFRWWIWDMILATSLTQLRLWGTEHWALRAQDGVSLISESAMATLCWAPSWHWHWATETSQEQDMSWASWGHQSLSQWEYCRGWRRSHVSAIMFQVLHLILLLALTSARPEPETPSSLLLRSLAWLRLPGLGFLLPQPQSRTLTSLASLPRLVPSFSRQKTNNREKRVHDNNSRQLCEDKITTNNFLIITPYLSPLPAPCLFAEPQTGK